MRTRGWRDVWLEAMTRKKDNRRRRGRGTMRGISKFTMSNVGYNVGSSATGHAGYLQTTDVERNSLLNSTRGLFYDLVTYALPAALRKGA